MKKDWTASYWWPTVRLPRLKGKAATAAIFEGFLLTTGGETAFAEWPQIVHWEKDVKLGPERADFVLYHMEGPATVVVCEDGAIAPERMMEAAGRVTGLAVMLAERPGVGSVRRVLAITSVGNPILEALLTMYLERKHVELFAMGPLEEHAAIARAAIRQLEQIRGRRR